MSFAAVEALPQLLLEVSPRSARSARRRAACPLAVADSAQSAAAGAPQETGQESFSSLEEVLKGQGTRREPLARPSHRSRRSASGPHAFSSRLHLQEAAGR